MQRRQENAILYSGFVRPAVNAGHGGDVKNLYNLYIYFWRWAMWKVFEHKTAAGPGVVSFISAASYIDGDAFVGVREHMRRRCDEIWILDLGGEGRGTRKTDNVFAIQTPVAIAIAVCYDKPNTDQPADVHYTRIEGDRNTKLNLLDTITEFSKLKWRNCPTDWHAPFRPAGKGAYFDSPLLIDLMPWQHGGVKVGRVWPIAPDEQTLRERWKRLCGAQPHERANLFINRPTGKKVDEDAKALPPDQGRLKAVLNLPSTETCPSTVRYLYRSFDRQLLIADGRLIDRAGPATWAAHSERQIYIITLFSQALGKGPALTACAEIPDLDSFRGSYGARAVLPLYRDAPATQPNIAPGLLDALDKQYGREVTPEDFLAYVYGLLAHPAFTARFEKELETRELRVPLTDDAALFEKVAEVGRKLLWLHTYAHRYTAKGRPKGRIPAGKARCTRPVCQKPEDYPERFEYDDQTQRLTVGDGVFVPVTPEVFGFEVSGLRVVKSWLGYRMKAGKGKKSSPLDDIRPEKWTAQFTTELLELLWVLEHTLAQYPLQAKLLDDVVSQSPADVAIGA